MFHSPPGQLCVMIRLINLRNLGTAANIQKWLRDPNHVYIGRTVRWANLRASKWRNPFQIKPWRNRQQVLHLYEQYINNNPYLKNCLSELEGKVLGCWCSPEPCHGDLLRTLAENYHLHITELSLDEETFVGFNSTFEDVNMCENAYANVCRGKSM